MARAIDRSKPAHAEALLADLIPDEHRRRAAVLALAQVAEVAAEVNPASWSITLQPGHVRLNVGQILMFQIGRENLVLAGEAGVVRPPELQEFLQASAPFLVMPGVCLYTTPHSREALLLVLRALLPACLLTAREAAKSRGPWRRAHSSGIIPLLEQALGHTLAWEAPGEPTGSAAVADVDPDQVVQMARALLPAERIYRRSVAITAAQMLIGGKLGSLSEPDLRGLLQLFNHDLVDGREVLGRFSTGLVGNNANLLIGRLATVNTVIPQLWVADDSWIAEHLAELRHGGTLPGGGWLFPTMVLHTRDPSRFFPMTKSMAQGLAAIDGLPVVSLRKDAGYLEYCARVCALLEVHQISPHGADVLLWQGAALAGTDADPDADERPTSAPIAAAPPPSPVQPQPQRLTPLASPAPVVVAAVVSAAHSPARPAHAGLSASTTPGPTASAGPGQARPDAPAKSGSVGWLHLTDLHQGMNGANWLWPNVLSMAFDDLARLHELCGPWDLVLFTGDLTQRGTAEQFVELDRTLERLWKRLDQLGSRPRLVTVPGNHDLDRPAALAPEVLAFSLWHSHRPLRDHVFGSDGNPYRARLREAFAAYTAWTERAPWFVRDNVTHGAMPGDLAASLSLHGLDLGIVGLNSAFLQLTDADFLERLEVDPRQLHQVCGHYAPEWLQRHHLNLLLTHHPPEWLEPRSRQEFHHEVDTAGRFAAHFFGHMHDGAAISTSHGGGQARHAIQGASLFGLEEHQGKDGRGVARIHGYSAGRFELVATPGSVERIRVRIFPRRMFASTGGRRIAPDVSGYDLDDRGSFAYEVATAKRA